MKLAHTPVHNIVAGDRVVSRTGMSGRIAAIYRAGDPAPVSSDVDGDIKEPRILILWVSGKWTLAEHHALDTVSHDIEAAPRNALLHSVQPRRLPPHTQRLVDGLRRILADMGPKRCRSGKVTMS